MQLGADTVAPVVIDTNIVLDLFVFHDPASQPLKQALQSGSLRWLATQDMRMELARVLGYPLISARLETLQLSADDVLAQFDRYARLTAVAEPAGVRCADTDDQKFIDLAVSHRATLLSKDRAVLRLRKRLQALGVSVRRDIDPMQGP
jgi:putative PIN family toxin of toxin-antitoxin system